MSRLNYLNEIFIIRPSVRRRSDGSRERMRARLVDHSLELCSGERTLRARLLETDAKNLPHNEANRAFTVNIIIFLYISFDSINLTNFCFHMFLAMRDGFRLRSMFKCYAYMLIRMK